MFELYDVKTNQFIMNGSCRAIAKKIKCAPSTVGGAYAKNHILRKKYIVKKNGSIRHSDASLYDVYDMLDDGKKIIESKTAKEVAEELHYSLAYLYYCEWKNKAFNDGRYMIEKVKECKA